MSDVAKTIANVLDHGAQIPGTLKCEMYWLNKLARLVSRIVGQPRQILVVVNGQRVQRLVKKP